MMTRILYPSAIKIGLLGRGYMEGCDENAGLGSGAERYGTGQLRAKNYTESAYIRTSLTYVKIDISPCTLPCIPMQIIQ